MKRQILLEEYDFHNGTLNVLFLDKDNNYREDKIDENNFEEFISESGRLESFEDKWDGYTESHYTKDYIMNYSHWLDEYCEKDDILTFLYYYYQENKLPKIMEE